MRVAWRDVWIGASVTALLFELGKILTGVASGFGAAGSLVVLLVWVYFSAQLFLLGAEFTWVYSHEYGSNAAETAPEPAPLAPSRLNGAAVAGDAKAAPPDSA